MSEPQKKRVAALAIEHYRQRLRGEMSKIDVPEWGVTVHWHAWTLEEKSRCWRPGGVDPTVYADVLIAKALDADGKAMFAPAERMEIVGEFDPTVVERVADAIMRDAVAVLAADAVTAKN